MKTKIFSSYSLILFLILIFSVTIFVLNPRWEIAGDGHGYYMYLRSLVFDGDFNFANEYERYDGIYGTDLVSQSISPIGRSGNPFAIGESILLTPFFFFALLFDYFLNLSTTDLPGFGFYYQLFLGLGSVFYTILGSVFLFKALKKLFSTKASWLAVITVIFCSPLLHYIIYEPLMSHGVSFFVTCLLFWYSIVLLKKEKINNQSLVFLGLLVGITILIRWQNGIFALLPLLICLKKVSDKKLEIKKILLSILTMILVFLPQLLMWKYLYGSFFLVPQGSGFIQVIQPKIMAVLFSGYHGLFSWHPFLLLGLIGLCFAFRKNKFLVAIMSIMLFLQVYLNASLLDWWGGSAFGARKMIGSLFIFAFGFGYLLDSLNKNSIKLVFFSVLILIAVTWNYLLLISSPRGFLPLDKPVSLRQIYLAPFELLR